MVDDRVKLLLIRVGPEAQLGRSCWKCRLWKALKGVATAEEAQVPYHPELTCSLCATTVAV